MNIMNNEMELRERDREREEKEKMRKKTKVQFHFFSFVNALLNMLPLFRFRLFKQSVSQQIVNKDSKE